MQLQIEQKEKSGLIRNMVNESEKNVDSISLLLEYIMEGVAEQYDLLKYIEVKYDEFVFFNPFNKLNISVV